MSDARFEELLNKYTGHCYAHANGCDSEIEDVQAARATAEAIVEREKEKEKDGQWKYEQGSIMEDFERGFDLIRKEYSGPHFIDEKEARMALAFAEVVDRIPAAEPSDLSACCMDSEYEPGDGEDAPRCAHDGKDECDDCGDCEGEANHG
jgi:hypothetical protein